MNMIYIYWLFSSVQLHPALGNPMNRGTQGLPAPRVHPNSCPLSRWCHPTISSSVIPFSSCPQSLPASESFPMSHISSHEVAKVLELQLQHQFLPVNTQDWSFLGWAGWNSLQSKGLWKSSPTPQFKSINSSALSFLHSPTLTSIRDHWKNHSLD